MPTQTSVTSSSPRHPGVKTFPTPRTLRVDTKAAFTLLEVLMALVIIAVLTAFLTRILQSALLQHKLIEDDIRAAPIHQAQLDQQFAGELEEPILELIPIEDEK